VTSTLERTRGLSWRASSATTVATIAAAAATTDGIRAALTSTV
jgi:hypothetical protein